MNKIIPTIFTASQYLPQTGPEEGEVGGCAAEDDLCSDCGACGKKEIAELEKQGHTYHCAARMVWGDGQCECQLKGIVPVQKWSQTCRGCGCVETWEATDFFDAADKLPSGWGYDQLLRGPVCPKCKV